MCDGRQKNRNNMVEGVFIFEMFVLSFPSAVGHLESTSKILAE